MTTKRRSAVRSVIHSLLPTIFVALCAFLVAVAELAGAAQENVGSALVVGFPDRCSVSRVYSDGRLELVDIPNAGPCSGGSAAYGTDLPHPSPDGRYIAFIGDGGMRLFDIRLGTVRNVPTPDGSAGEGNGSSRIYITAWSWDSRRLLFYLAPALDAGASRDAVVRSMVSAEPGGFRIYDIGNGVTERIRLPGRPVAWLADGSFLLVLDDSKAAQPPHRWRPGDKTPTPFVVAKANYGQFQVAWDGRSAVATATYGQKGSEIVRIHTTTGEVNALTPRRGYVYNWPALSPSGKLAYLLYSSDRAGKIHAGHLVVDGKNIAPYTGWAKFSWIGEDALALRDGCALTVVDLRDGRVRAEHRIPVRDQSEQVSRERYCKAREEVK